MPWSNNDGGRPTNGGRPNGQRPGGPWGQGPRGPQRPGGGGGGNPPPDLEEILKRSQDRLRTVLPRGTGQGPKFTPFVIGLIAVGALVLYGLGGYYRVEPDEQAVELVFGDPKEEIMGEGPHFVFWPFESYEKVQINERKITVGSSARRDERPGLMLSGDQNIVDVTFSVLYSVANPQDFLFRVRDPEAIVAEVAESAMREVVGRRPAQDVFRDDRLGIEQAVLAIVQDTLNSYNTGVLVRAITLEDAAPPADVADAFEDVQRAEQEEDRVQEVANARRNQLLGQVRGEAAAIRESAAAYKNRVVQEAEGEAQRFLNVYEGYRVAPEATKRRLFLETMEEVLAGRDKVIIESGTGGQGVVPYLPLNELQRGGNPMRTNTNVGN